MVYPYKRVYAVTKIMYLQNITVHVPRIHEAQKQDIVYIVYIQ